MQWIFLADARGGKPIYSLLNSADYPPFKFPPKHTSLAVILFSPIFSSSRSR
jgi:hypothetical protein